MDKAKIPSGHQQVMPYFLVPDAAAFIEFLRDVLGASEREVHRGPDGRLMHGEYTIGGSVLMFGESSPEWPASSSMNYLYVADTDRTHADCLRAGCTELYAPRDESYGMRSSGVKDRWGNTWWLAEPL